MTLSYCAKRFVSRFTRNISKLLAFTLTIMTICKPDIWAEQDQATRLGVVPQERLSGDTLIITDERIEVDCIAHGTQLDCESKSRLTVENKRSSPSKFVLEADRRASSLKIDDTSLTLMIPKDSEKIQPAFAEAEFRPGVSELFVHIPRAFHLDASPKSGDMFFTPILNIRHPLLHEYPGKPTGVEISIKSVGKYHRWGRVDRTHVQLTLPSNWRWMLTGENILEPSYNKDTIKHASNEHSEIKNHLSKTEEKIEWDWSRTSDDSTPFTKKIGLAPHAHTFFNGGPFLGVGIAHSNNWPVRVRAGYEIGIESWGLLNVAGEYSPKNNFIIIPSFDIAEIPYIPRVLHSLIPATSCGVGIPLYVKPHRFFGIRGQASAHWPVVNFMSTGIVFTLDYFPSQHWTAPFLLGTAMFQVGL